jgi:hypothetical protein
MATLTLRRFSRPTVLRAIAPARLRTFLQPHRDYLATRGVRLPKTDSPGGFDYESLAHVFLAPDQKTPRELIDAIYLIDEMSTHQGMDALLAEVEKRNLKLAPGDEHSPADIAVQVWLLDKEILERLHAERQIIKVRRFEYYQMAQRPQPKFKCPSEEQLHGLARDLDIWFEGKKRGRGTRIIACERPDGIWFLIRHGDPIKREESLDGFEASTIYYRPLKYDVVLYSPEIGELRINARSAGETKLYRAKFGEHFFGGADAFPGTNKYTLEPLRELGEDALAPGDIEGIDWIKLEEVQLYYDGKPYELVTRKSNDFFALLQRHNRVFPEEGRLFRAKFQVKFSDARTPRSVVIRPSNIAQFTRDDDSVIVEQWLAARGFILNCEDIRYARPEAAMAGN